ncbi:glycosyltransferase [Candidatus Microgenomates bacterium]|nr:glycosyltransferase [Candidatus Microgenomates bacterium]
MKIKKSLIDKYNNSQNLIVISSYPQKGEIYSGKVGGIASFTKNTVRHLPHSAVVIAEYFDRPEVYEENETLVVRCFKKNTTRMWFEIFKTLFQFRAIQKVLFQFDFALYGDLLVSSLVIPFWAIIKLFGYRIFVVTHTVILDVFTLSGHLGIKNTFQDKLKGIIFNKIFHLFYFLLGILADKVITTEEILKNRLVNYIDEEKLLSIAHGVDRELKPQDKDDARKKLNIGKNEQVILFFGFINWFKGADLFVSSFAKTNKLLGKKTRFIIAGGESATLSQKDFYRQYFAEVVEKVQKTENIEITGFVPQSKIALYFSASDLVVFPYRSFISASGVLSLVFSYQKPFIVSSNIAGMFETIDFKAALKSVGLRKEDLVFTMEDKELLSTSTKVLKDGLKRKMITFTQIVRKERDWKKIASLYDQVIFAPFYTLNGAISAEKIVLTYAESKTC